MKKKLIKEKNILSKQNEIELNHGKAYAKAASLDKNNRGRAKTVLKVLTITENCPYCGKIIGDNPHADHINPISSGGLSSLENMVYVCSACNNKKGEKGLLEFIITNNHDINRVYHTLKSLGKKI